MEITGDIQMRNPQSNFYLPAWGRALFALLAFALCCNLLVMREKSHIATARASSSRDFQNGKLSTPEAFQTRCGKASWTTKTASGELLRYNKVDIQVTLPSDGAPSFQLVKVYRKNSGKYFEAPVNVSDEFGLERLNCLGK